MRERINQKTEKPGTIQISSTAAIFKKKQANVETILIEKSFKSQRSETAAKVYTFDSRKN